MIDPKRRCTNRPKTREMCGKVLGHAAKVVLPLLPTALLLTIGLLQGSTELILIGWAFGCVMWKMHMAERRMERLEKKPTDPFVGY